jgi:hypothetical protein
VINVSIAEVSTSRRSEPRGRLSRQPRDISTAQSSDSWEPTYEYIESTTTNIVDTISKIAKEAGEVAKDIPYIKAFAGIVIQIITIREVRELWRT